jgi:hypothetical protein
MQDDIDLDAREKRAAKRSEKLREEKRAEQSDIVQLMHEPFGRRLVHKMLAEARCFHTTFADGDPHKTSFNEGKRSLGLWLLSQVIQQTPEQYALMMKEATDAQV